MKMRLKEGNDLPKDTHVFWQSQNQNPRFLLPRVDSAFCLVGRGEEEDRL